jgi:phosphoglycolate phosphatase
MCMVGDRLDTDILFGQNTGCKTLLVMSGKKNLLLFSCSGQSLPCVQSNDQINLDLCHNCRGDYLT